MVGVCARAVIPVIPVIPKRQSTAASAATRDLKFGISKGRLERKLGFSIAAIGSMTSIMVLSIFARQCGREQPWASAWMAGTVTRLPPDSGKPARVFLFESRGHTERTGTEDADEKPGPAKISLIIAGTRCRYTWPTAN